MANFKGIDTRNLLLEELHNISSDPQFITMTKAEKELYLTDRVVDRYMNLDNDKHLTNGESTSNSFNNTRSRVLRPMSNNRFGNPNGFIENSIIVTILVLATILGLIIGSIIALYK